MWTPLHASVHTTLKQKQLLGTGERVLLAVSGGQDSLCLLQLFLDLRKKWFWDLAIAHCDHGWSYDLGLPEHVQTLAEQYGLPFYLKTASGLQETEAAARNWRYQALTDIAQRGGFTAIATGHTQTDQAETFFYNLMRGTGADGLTALTWQRPLSPTLRLVRPLLDISRTETLAFCQLLELPIWEDAANQELKYARNRIRAKVFPYLQEHFNPQLEKALAQTAELLRAEVDYLEVLAQEVLEKAIHPDLNQLHRVILRPIPLALQRRVIRQFLRRVLHKASGFEAIESVVSLINAPHRSCTSTLKKGVIATVEGDWIQIKLLG